MTKDEVRVERYSAFSEDPDGGNPAGVVLDAAQLSASRMQGIAADIGYSETAFVTGPIGRDVPIPIRYFAPQGEVDFCGHATIATAVAIGATVGQGAYTLSTKVGPVGVVARLDGTRTMGTLRSPAIDCFPLEPELLSQLLDGLYWSVHDLDQTSRLRSASAATDILSSSFAMSIGSGRCRTTSRLSSDCAGNRTG